MSQNEYTAIAAQVKEFRELTAKIDQLTKERDALKFQMIATLNDHELEEFTGENFIIRYKSYERTTFDSKGFAESHPKLFKAFTKVSRYMRFTVN
ncbi:MAG: hypothetical protein J6M06_03740 [Synergistaceae bacterium]|nr:hypothetical protein [Synergistaceae bacterium]MBP3837349.1 hypothetical protein [Pyramidobacter sp.]